MKKFEGLIVPKKTTEYLDKDIIDQYKVCECIFALERCDNISCEYCILDNSNKTQYDDFLDTEGIMA